LKQEVEFQDTRGLSLRTGSAALTQKNELTPFPGSWWDGEIRTGSCRFF